jgi:hypothetical protein
MLHPSSRRAQPSSWPPGQLVNVGRLPHVSYRPLNVHALRRARQFASWLGVTPPEHSSGVRRRLGEGSESNSGPNDTFVAFEHELNAAVKRLRDLLGDSADSP